jgi:hypothetical protein
MKLVHAAASLACTGIGGLSSRLGVFVRMSLIVSHFLSASFVGAGMVEIGFGVFFGCPFR